MDLPANLAQWTLDTINDLVRKDEFEPGPYDFKGALNESKPAKSGENNKSGELTESIRRTACGMANTRGGFIIFGVQDRMTPHGDPLERIVGIPMTGEHRKEFGDKIQPIRPPLSFDAFPKPIEVTGKPGQGVFVVRVPLSPARPHEYGGIFYRRADAGKAEPMDVTQVRDQMLFGEERLRKLELLRTEIAFIRQTLDLMKVERDENLRTYRIDSTAIKPLLAETCSMFPDKRIEEGLGNLVLAATHANGLMDRLFRQATEGGVSSQLAGDWRTAVHHDLEQVQKLCHECGAQVFAVLKHYRGERA
jgi:hypothetical protein